MKRSSRAKHTLGERKCRLPVNMLASSRSTRVPSLVEIQVKCKGSTSRSPVNAVKLPSAAAQLLTFPFPAAQNTPSGSNSSHWQLYANTEDVI